MSEIFVGIDVGETNVKIGLFDSELKLICKTSVTTEADIGPEVVINNMAHALQKICADIGCLVKDICLADRERTRLSKCDKDTIKSNNNRGKPESLSNQQIQNDKGNESIVFENNGDIEQEKGYKQTEVPDQKNAHIFQKHSPPPKVFKPERDLNFIFIKDKRTKYRLILPSFVLNWLENREIRHFLKENRRSFSIVKTLFSQICIS